MIRHGKDGEEPVYVFYDDSVVPSPGVLCFDEPGHKRVLPSNSFPLVLLSDLFEGDEAHHLSYFPTLPLLSLYLLPPHLSPPPPRMHPTRHIGFVAVLSLLVSLFCVARVL